MSSIYASLQVSPRKKRCPPSPDQDANTYSPKKLRVAPPTPPASVSRKGDQETTSDLPHHLSRLHTIHTGLQHALSHALATCAVSPTADTGIVRNVLNHLSLTTYTGLTTQFSVDDLRRLCWIWEWDAISLDSSLKKGHVEEENPFLDPPKSNQPKDWTRGSMGIILSPASHYSKTEGKRVPAYGIGIEVEMDIDRDMVAGMAAVARWTAASEERRAEVRKKLLRWVELHKANDEDSPVPHIPLADLPKLSASGKTSSSTRIFGSVSPTKVTASPSKLPTIPFTPTSLLRSPSKCHLRDFAVPFPATPSSRPSTPTKNTVLFPTTPSSHRGRSDSISSLNLRTPTTSNASLSDVTSTPSTPVHHRGAGASTAPQTPTTSRRQALYERVRQRSLSPSKTPGSRIALPGMSKDQMLKLSQDELRRRCLLGRLGGVAESVWMLFSSPTASTSATPSKRKRRALPMSEVSAAIIKSSPVPVSASEANESLEMLVKLCPFFLRQLNITGAAWLEMPAGSPDGSPTKVEPQSPSKSRNKTDSAEEILTRSPRRVKKEGGGLREVREIIRKELELTDA